MWSPQLHIGSHHRHRQRCRAYCVRHFFIDVSVAIIAAALVSSSKRWTSRLPSFVMAFVLARLIEKCFRRSLMSQRALIIISYRPICIILWLLLV
jgi:TctA family transporter